MHPTPTYAGIDWASRSHAVCVIDGSGSVLERYEVEHSEVGLQSLARRLTTAHVDGVAIERPDGPVTDALLEAGLRVVVIASRQVKALRSRYGLAGNKDDCADAYVLADVLRTDGHRLRPLLPDSDATVALRALVGDPNGVRDIAGHREPTVDSDPPRPEPSIRCSREMSRDRPSRIS